MKNLFKLIIITFSFIIIILFHNCKKCGYGDPDPPLSGYSISFSIIDKITLEDAIPIKYHPDSIKILNWELIDLKIKYYINDDSIYVYYPLYYYDNKTDAESNNNEIIKNYYIYFDKTDTDTLEFRFKTIK